MSSPLIAKYHPAPYRAPKTPKGAVRPTGQAIALKGPRATGRVVQVRSHTRHVK